MHPQPKILPALLALAFALPLHAAQTPADDEALTTVVTATRSPTRISSVLSDTSVITRADIERSGQNRVVDLLGSQPGVQYSSTGGPGAGGALFLRGTNSEHTLILIDGQRVSSATAGTTAIEHLPVDQIERIEIVRGSASSLYGADAIGGVIQIFTRRGSGAPAADFSFGAGSNGTTKTSVGYGGEIGATRFDLRVAGERSDGISDIRNAGSSAYSPYNPDRDGYRNLSLSARVAHKLNAGNEIGLQLLRIDAEKHYDAANCDNNWPITCTTNYDNRLQQRLASTAAYWRSQPFAAWTSTVNLGQTQDALQNYRIDPSQPGELRDRYRTTQDQFSWQNDLRLGTFGKLLAALEWRQERVASTQPLDADRRDTRSSLLGYQGEFGAHSLQTSLRRDNISGFQGVNSWSAAYGYEIFSGLRLRAATGVAYHVPTFNQLYWPVDMSNFYQGNPNLRPEHARNRELGIRYETGASRIELSAYRNRVTDLLNYVVIPVAPFGQTENVGRATLKGATLAAQTRTGAWLWKGSFDYLNARDDISGRLLQRRVPRSATLETVYRRDRLEANVQVQGYSSHFNDAANTQRLGAYTLVNTGASWQLGQGWSLFGRINNLLDRKYVAARDPFNGNDYGAPGLNLFAGIKYTPEH